MTPLTRGAQPTAVDGALPKFLGSWKGKTVCRKLGSWKLSLNVKQQADGSYVTQAATEGAGEFSELLFKGDAVTLRYSSLQKDTTYIGRLVSPDRIEGTVKIQEDCTWYLTR